MSTSAVPAAVDALLALLRAAPALADVRIVDGPEPTNLSDRRLLFIGWAPGSDAAVELAQDFANAGARRRDEDFRIACYAEARAGDKDMAIRRRAVYEIVAAVEDALRATDVQPDAPTLGGTVQWAHLTTGNLQQIQAEGAVAGLSFVITCHARI
jgi:hypothetical protein